VAYQLDYPGRAAFIVDEAVTVTEDEVGARTLGDVVRRSRHFGLEVHVVTQRVTDWFDSRIGRTIQSVAASKWFGQMEARELYEIAPSPRDLARGARPHRKGRPGREAADKGPARVGESVRPHLAWRVFAMANTDVVTSTDDGDDQNSSHGFGRIGHAAATAAYTAGAATLSWGRAKSRTFGSANRRGLRLGGGAGPRFRLRKRAYFGQTPH
jgi:hypothetical protein